MKKRHLITPFLFAISSLLASSIASASDILRQYELTITNTTNSHVFTPTLVVTHGDTLSLFKIGAAASEGLATQAETGNPAVLLAEAEASGAVDHAMIGGFIGPGQSATYIISANKRSKLSFTAMLADTNDAFVALNSVTLPRHRSSKVAYAYDAGSEANNEQCAYIPGPQCASDPNNLRDENAEGFVSIHNGIHGVGDLNAAVSDWRGPVALVTLKRIDN